MTEKKYKIFILEDEPELADIFTSILKKCGFQVESANNGKTALEKIKRFKPDLSLLDLVVPEVDGYEVIEALRKDDAMKDSLIYAFSNLTQKDEVDRARKMGADGYLIKSDYTPNKLLDKVREILNNK